LLHFVLIYKPRNIFSLNLQLLQELCKLNIAGNYHVELLLHVLILPFEIGDIGNRLIGHRAFQLRQNCYIGGILSDFNESVLIIGLILGHFKRVDDFASSRNIVIRYFSRFSVIALRILPLLQLPVEVVLVQEAFGDIKLWQAIVFSACIILS